MINSNEKNILHLMVEYGIDEFIFMAILLKGDIDKIFQLKRYTIIMTLSKEKDSSSIP
jgi:hypothetical protein